MLVRRYQGRNEEEAIAKAKAELGPNAVILHIKELSKNGIFNLKSAAKVELVVALDQDLYEEENKVTAYRAPSTPTSSSVKSKEDDEPVRRPLIKGESGDVVSVQKKRQDLRHKPGGFRAYAVSEYSNVKETSEPKAASVPNHREGETTERKEQFPDKVGFSEAAQKLYQHLLSHEVQEEVAQKLSQSCHELISGEPPLSLQEAMNVCIEELISTSGGLNIAKRPAVVAFVGPTGVGKTTTIAKLAAHYHLKENQKISLITVDTYRIAAIEQLKTYATYIGVPLEVALTPQEMHQSVRKYKNCDLILIDTPGRSQKDSLKIQELAMLLSAAQPTEVHLLLNVTTEHRILWDIVRGFKALFPNRLLFTKLDESISFGHILNMSVAFGKPISYLTTGQDVPDDIQLATIERITECLLREEDVYIL